VFVSRSYVSEILSRQFMGERTLLYVLYLTVGNVKRVRTRQSSSMAVSVVYADDICVVVSRHTTWRGPLGTVRCSTFWRRRRPAAV